MLSELKSAWDAGNANNVTLIAAGVAHYALLALVPALGAVILAYGVFADPATVAGHILLLSEQLPATASELIAQQLRNVSEGAEGAQGLGLVVSLAIALFGARSAAQALIKGLNTAFAVDQSRGFVRGNLVALAITVAGIAGLVLVAAASAVLPIWFGALGAGMSFVLLLGAATTGAALLYRFVPNKPPPSWGSIWPGALLFSAGWLVATAGFAFYAANFGSYNATYGSLGAVIVLITWFYLTAFLLLLGAELVAQNEGRTATPGGKAT